MFSVSRFSYKTLILILLFLLIPIVLFLRISQNNKDVYAEWWDETWMYRQSINISSHTSDETDVYITAAISLSSTDKAQTDAGDFRFLNSTGQILPYYIVSGAGTTSITFHIALAAFDAGAQTLYAYYGNPSAENGFSASDFSTQASNYTLGSQGSEEIGGGPIAYWKFDEGVGTTAQDSSSNNNHSTVFSSNWTNEESCISNKCLSFNGSSNYISVPDSPSLDPTNAVTLQAWVNINATPGDAGKSTPFFTIAQKNGGYSGMGVYGLRINSTKTVSANLSHSADISDSYTVTTTQTLDKNKWYFISFTYNQASAEIKIYIDGKLVTTNTNYSQLLMNSTSPFLIAIGDGRYYSGLLDEVKIYPYARSDAQIKADYAAGLAGTSTSSDSSVSFGTSSTKFLSDGLVGYWKFDEGVGTTSADSSGNNNLFTFAAGDSSPSWSSGKYGIGTSFDGINDYATSSDLNSVEGLSSMSVQAWIKPNSITSDKKFAAKENVWYFFTNTCLGSNQVGFVIHGKSSCIESEAVNTGITLNQWSHVIAVYENNTTKLYLNGSLVDSAESITMPTSDYSFSIGAKDNDGSSFGSFFDGLIDEVRVYNRALSPTEVKQLYEFAPGPVGYWKMDEKNGQEIKDYSGNNYFGTFGTGDSSPSWIIGKYGGGLNFDGSDFVDHNDVLDMSISDLTISTWIKTNNVPSTQYFLSKAKAAAQNYRYAIGLLSPGLPRLFMQGDGGADIVLNSSTNIADNKWHHISYIFDRDGSASIYIDGKYDSSIGISHWAGVNMDSSNPFRIGSYTASDNITPSAFFDGSLDEVKIYNYARTQKQILEDMNATSPVGGFSSKVANPIAYYKFDEGFGSTTANWGIGGTGYDLILGTGSTIPTWISDGKINKGLNFGRNSLVQMINYQSDLEYTNAKDGLTLSAWVNPSSNEIDGGEIISKAWNGGGQYNYRLRYNSNSTINLQIGGSNTYSFSTTDTLSSDTWHHIVATIDTNTQNAKIYINGKLSNQGTNTVTDWTVTDGNVKLAIGCIYPYATSCTAGTIYAFNGLIDEVKIYNYALSADQIKQDYNQGSSAVFGSTSQTIGATTTSLEYCVPGDTTYCAPPVGEWKFDEGVGTTAFDSSGNNNGARFYSTTSWSTGKIGKGISLNGTTDYSSVTDPASGILDFDSNSFTISTWVKKGTLTGQKSIIQKLSGTAGVNPGWTIYQHSGNNLTFLVADGDGAGYYNGVATTPINDNNWHHVTAVADKNASKLFLYVDGALKNSAVITDYASGSVSGSDNLTFGSGWGFMDGKIDQVRVYNYARTPAQIAYDYNRGEPVGWWKMDECQGTLINDWSGNANHGTLSVGSSASPISPGTCSTADTAWGNGKTGKINSSLSFNGPDDHIKLNQILGQVFWKSRNRSISAWIKPTSASLTGNHNFITAYETQWNYTRMWFTINSGKLSFLYTIYPSVTTVTLLSQNNLTADTWYHATVTWDENTYYLYLNGVLQSTYDNSLITTDNPQWTTIGGDIRYGNYFFGQIDDVQIYNYALTPTQIKTIYNNGAVTFR